MFYLLETHTLTFDYYTSGYDNDGRWVEIVADNIVALGSLQPYRDGEKASILPEGVTVNDARIFYTKVPLGTDNVNTKTAAYSTKIGDNTFEVFMVEDWTGFGLAADHYKITLIRRDLPTGGGL